MRPYACALQADQDFLQELFGKLAVAGSRLYNAAVHGLQLLALINKPKHWAASIRDGLSESKAFKKWRKTPKHTEKTVNALAQLMLEAWTQNLHSVAQRFYQATYCVPLGTFSFSLCYSACPATGRARAEVH